MFKLLDAYIDVMINPASMQKLKQDITQIQNLVRGIPNINLGAASAGEKITNLTNKVKGLGKAVSDANKQASSGGRSPSQRGRDGLEDAVTRRRLRRLNSRITANSTSVRNSLNRVVINDENREAVDSYSNSLDQIVNKTDRLKELVNRVRPERLAKLEGIVNSTLDGSEKLRKEVTSLKPVKKVFSNDVQVQIERIKALANKARSEITRAGQITIPGGAPEKVTRVIEKLEGRFAELKAARDRAIASGDEKEVARLEGAFRSLARSAVLSKNAIKGAASDLRRLQREAQRLNTPRNATVIDPKNVRRARLEFRDLNAEFVNTASRLRQTGRLFPDFLSNRFIRQVEAASDKVRDLRSEFSLAKTKAEVDSLTQDLREQENTLLGLEKRVNALKFAYSRVAAPGTRLGRIASIAQTTGQLFEGLAQKAGLSADKMALAGQAGLVAGTGIGILAVVGAAVADVMQRLGLALARLAIRSAIAGLKLLYAPLLSILNVTRQLVNYLPFLFAGLIGSTVSYSRELAKINALFNQAFGRRGADQIQFVRDLAEELGFSFSNAAAGYAKLASVLGRTLDQKGLQELFRAVTSATTALGLGKEQLDRIFLAFSQISGKGFAAAEEIFRQLTDSLNEIVDITAKGLGSSPDEILARIQARDIKALEFFRAFTDEALKRYGETAKTAAQSVNAEFERLANRVNFAKEILGDIISLPLVKGLRGLFDDIFGAPADQRENLRKAFQPISDLVGVLQRNVNRIKKFFAEVASAIGPVIARFLRIQFIVNSITFAAIIEGLKRIAPIVDSLLQKFERLLGVESENFVQALARAQAIIEQIGIRVQLTFNQIQSAIRAVQILLIPVKAAVAFLLTSLNGFLGSVFLAFIEVGKIANKILYVLSFFDPELRRLRKEASVLNDELAKGIEERSKMIEEEILKNRKSPDGFPFTGEGITPDGSNSTQDVASRAASAAGRILSNAEALFDYIQSGDNNTKAVRDGNKILKEISLSNERIAFNIGQLGKSGGGLPLGDPMFTVYGNR